MNRELRTAMGIRFLCPNGHKLNVKAFLAGERGICPQCDAKFLVPSESGGQVEAIAEPSPVAEVPTTDAVVEEPVATEQAGTAPPPPPAATPVSPRVESAPKSETPPEVWYVRTATGEQYGPADANVMRDWVAQGRVTAACFVWRTGWGDWKPGGHAITQLNVAPPDPAQADPPAIGMTQQPAAPGNAGPQQTDSEPELSKLPEASVTSANYHTNKRLRQERARKITLLLGVVVVILFAVLIGVLINNQ